MLDENERREDAGRTLASDGFDFLSLLFLSFSLLYALRGVGRGLELSLNWIGAPVMSG